jgi:predicted ATPase
MKIKFQNLGSIKKAELDLRPLTVIIGPNNSNKTYIAYSIYGLWKQLNSNSFNDYCGRENINLPIKIRASQENKNI